MLCRSGSEAAGTFSSKTLHVTFTPRRSLAKHSTSTAELPQTGTETRWPKAFTLKKEVREDYSFHEAQQFTRGYECGGSLVLNGLMNAVFPYKINVHRGTSKVDWQGFLHGLQSLPSLQNV